jgi:hypothetical protein
MGPAERASRRERIASPESRARPGPVVVSALMKLSTTEPWRKRLFWLIVTLVVVFVLINLYLGSTQLTG